jgi:RNA polymerase sigma factor (sigma-70 family)
MERDHISAEGQAPSDKLLLRAHAERTRLLSFVRRRVASAEDAEDILQDVFTRLLDATSLAEPIDQVTAWLFRTARNRVIDWYRRKRHRATPMSDLEFEAPPFLDRLMADPEEDQASRLLRSMVWDEVNEALEELPEAQREVFIAHEIDGKSFKEIAEETGVSINTLLSRKRYAVLFLRERLQDLYDELSEE